MSWMILAYLSEATDQEDEKYQSKMELVVQQLKLGYVDQAQTTINRNTTNTHHKAAKTHSVDA